MKPLTWKITHMQKETIDRRKPAQLAPYGGTLKQNKQVKKNWFIGHDIIKKCPRLMTLTLQLHHLYFQHCN